MALTTDSTGSRSRNTNRRRTYRTGAPAGYPKVVVIALAIDETYRTDGTQTPLATVVEVPEIAESGPMISRMRVHWSCNPATTNFSGKVQLQWSMLNRVWSTATDLITAQTGVKDQVIGDWTSGDTNFGLNLQFLMTVANSAGTAQESGRVTAWLEIEFKS